MTTIDSVVPCIFVFNQNSVVQVSKMIDHVKMWDRYDYEYSCARNYYYIFVFKLCIVNNV